MYDPTPFYGGHRNIVCVSKTISPELGLRFMNEPVRALIEKSLSGNLVFQLLHENCAAMPQKNAEWLGEQGGYDVPDYYLEQVANLQAQIKPLNFVFFSVRNLPEPISSYLATAYNCMLGYHRGMTVEEDGKKVFRL